MNLKKLASTAKSFTRQALPQVNNIKSPFFGERDEKLRIGLPTIRRRKLRG
jgi:hypothetical protein